MLSKCAALQDFTEQICITCSDDATLRIWDRQQTMQVSFAGFLLNAAPPVGSGRSRIVNWVLLSPHLVKQLE